MNKTYFELIKERRSIRQFQSRDVEMDKIKEIINALRLAPSSSNSQPWHVVVVQDRDTIDKLSQAAPLGSRFVISWLADAPLVFVLTVKRRLTHGIAGAFGHYNVWLDAGIGGQQMVLAAHALGLGCCWIGWFDEKKIKKLISLPNSYHVVALIPCGYPDEIPRPQPRKPTEEMCSHDRFGKRHR